MAQECHDRNSHLPLCPQLQDADIVDLEVVVSVADTRSLRVTIGAKLQHKCEPAVEMSCIAAVWSDRPGPNWRLFSTVKH